MKVLLLNGSPHERGCTIGPFRGGEELGGGRDPDCLLLDWKSAHHWLPGVWGMRQGGQMRIFRWGQRFRSFAKEADGFVFGAPVHYAAAAGGITAFLDRAFYSASSAGAQVFRLKPAAAIVSARRAGTTAALDQLNKYFTISQMPIISSRYWNMVHGNTPAEVEQDLEGMQVMRFLGRNMAYFLKCIEAGRKAGVPLPREEGRIATNFIR